MQAKNFENGQQGQGIFGQMPLKLANGIESGRAKLSTIEEQAQTLFEELRSRGGREIESIKERLTPVKLTDKLPVNHLVDRARSVESDARGKADSLAEALEERVQRLQSSVFSVVGIATKDQISLLSRDLDRLSRRLDKLARQAKKDTPPPTEKSRASATKAKSATKPKKSASGRSRS